MFFSEVLHCFRNTKQNCAQNVANEARSLQNVVKIHDKIILAISQSYRDVDSIDFKGTIFSGSLKNLLRFRRICIKIVGKPLLAAKKRDRLNNFLSGNGIMVTSRSLHRNGPTHERLFASNASAIDFQTEFHRKFPRHKCFQSHQSRRTSAGLVIQVQRPSLW